MRIALNLYESYAVVDLEQLALPSGGHLEQSC